jgi:hypothetical protein
MTVSHLNSPEEEMQHIISYDCKGRLLEGRKEYKLHLPSDIPASEFWSLIVYDFINRSMISTDQSWPSVFYTSKNLLYNSDGSVDVWFGPKPFEGREKNWVKTIPGKNWYVILRLYYPLDSWFEKKWRPGEIEELNADDK